MNFITIILCASFVCSYVFAQNCNNCDCTKGRVFYKCYCAPKIDNNCSHEKQNILPFSKAEIFANPSADKIQVMEIRDIAIGTLEFTQNLDNLKELTFTSCNINIIDENSFYNVVNLRELTIENNNIEIFSDHAFENITEMHFLKLRNNSLQKILDLNNLSELLHLDVGMNNIDKFNPKLFTKNTKLQKIYLDKNNLVQLPKGVFDGLTDIMEINLAENKIEELPDGIFSNLNMLKKIYLQNNKLTSIVSNFFENSPRIENILLDGNEIKHLDWNIFNYLPKLSYINIPDSSIKCDCKARQFINIYKDIQERKISGTIQCSNSKVKKISDLKFGDFACAPKILNCVEGKEDNMTKISCLINGDPRPDTTWRFNGTVVHNNTFFNLKFESISEDIFWSNLTISKTSINISGLYEIEARNEGGPNSYNYHLKIAAPAESNTPQANYLSTGGIAGISVGIGIGVLLGVAVAIGSFMFYNKKRGQGHLPVETKKPEEKKRSKCYSIELEDVISEQSSTKQNYIPADEGEKVFWEQHGLLEIQERRDKNRESYYSTGSNDEHNEQHI